MPKSVSMPESFEGRLAHPVGWVGAVMVVAIAAIGLQPTDTDWPLVAVAVGCGAAVTVAAWRIPWRRLPRTALISLPIGCDLVIALLRQAQGGSTSGYAPLAILPVVFAGLALRPWHARSMALVTATLFAFPMLVVGGPMYPSSGWRGVALWTLVALIVGGAASRGMAAQRQHTQASTARARELDRIVETQTAIVASSMDLDAVMRTVVSEARDLTQADAAVVELPDGKDLVYRAVSGTAEGHLGLRLAAATALSGAALRGAQTLVCTDTEEDSRVDRAACRRVGARSMVVVPLIHEGEGTGVLKVYSDRRAAFEDRHVKVLTLLANLIGGSLARAELLTQLQSQADTDQLTGLANRRFWSSHLDQALARSRRQRHPLSVILLDLDDFKRVNDTQGHAAGDRLLRSVSGRWNALTRETDLLGRLGGDEFAVILEQADGAAASELAARLMSALPDGQGCSVGVATWDGQEEGTELIARADGAMYRHKRARKPDAAGLEATAA
jgi:diguanylate cyclase